MGMIIPFYEEKGAQRRCTQEAGHTAREPSLPDSMSTILCPARSCKGLWELREGDGPAGLSAGLLADVLCCTATQAGFKSRFPSTCSVTLVCEPASPVAWAKKTRYQRRLCPWQALGASWRSSSQFPALAPGAKSHSPPLLSLCWPPTTGSSLV